MIVLKGRKFRTRQALKVTCMTAWAAPYTGGSEVLLPRGEVFIVTDDPLPTSTAIYADPLNYEDLETMLVRPEDRAHPKYRGFYLCINLKDIEEHCELLA